MQKLLDELFSVSFLKGILHIIVILILTWLALRLAKRFSAGLIRLIIRKKEDEEFQKRTTTLGNIVRYALISIIVAISGITVLREVGIDIGPILATAGIGGLAIGFGAQSLVKDVISGFFILMEDQIRVGDVVEIGGKSGSVEKISLKTTVLRDMSGNVHYVPNGQISVVTNMTKEYSRYVFEIGVAYKEDVDEVMEIIKKIDEEMRHDPEFKDDILEPIEVLGVDQFADSAVIIKARTTTLPIKQWRVAREFNRRIKKRFDELKIEIPFPHVTVYMGEGKDGQAPPLRIVKDNCQK
ncbi:mechanosensitive ion channel family protein [Thermodesulfovibrio thiophilus]|uniref:mechanosensitive ion channel family protein n=1 Tax=Thermodesulfovibrio thiophilus TaxID=340095 RepID=UPI000491BEF7|nr:mechanosensitive ion channel family protein [Thermodesulfovibrio thiophilus]HOA83406.1 mechanosensitive ion channel family protein [Thermodesulfovibrio thiophilus]